MKLTFYVISFLGYFFAAADAFSFGIRGEDGRYGTSGRSGVDGESLVIYSGKKSMIHSSTGSDGENGTIGMPGRDAYQCRQPYKPRRNIKGANGGDGGNGGKGGNGGNGGSALIFYNQLSDLSRLTLINNGGQGGIGARGGEYGGYPCLCEERSWQFFTCEWQLYRKEIVKVIDQPVNKPGKGKNKDKENKGKRKKQPPIAENSNYWERTWTTRKTDCTETRRPPSRPYRDENYRYRWELKNERTKTYYCDDGLNGYPGTYGSNGRDGKYGDVTLVKGKAIPKDSPVDTARLSESLSKFYPLSKNVFVKKTGLRAILSTKSRTTDKYKIFVRTDKKKFGIAWRLPNGPAYYGLQNKQIKVTLEQDPSGNTEFKIDLKGNPIYGVKKLDANHWQIRITGFSGREPSPRDSRDLCADKNGKGKNLCEFSGGCIYEVGICKRR